MQSMEGQKRCKREMPECKVIFEVADATCLTYETEQFDVLVARKE